QVVRHLVCVDADQRWVDLVDRAEERLFVDGTQLRGENVLQLWIEETPVGARASDQVLPRPALRLVHAKRDTASERRALQRRIDAPFVDPVTELVHRCEDGGEIIGAKVRRVAHVALRGRALEGMLVRAEAPLLVREAEASNDRVA